MTIPPEIAFGILAVLLLLVAGVGFAIGLWVGERGRRRDMQWWTGLNTSPRSDEEREPEYVPAASADEKALVRAEIAALEEGLRQELRRVGMNASDEEIQKEALRLSSQYHVAPSEDL